MLPRYQLFIPIPSNRRLRFQAWTSAIKLQQAGISDCLRRLCDDQPHLFSVGYLRYLTMDVAEETDVFVEVSNMG